MSNGINNEEIEKNENRPGGKNQDIMEENEETSKKDTIMR